jgi:hypothetical protein
VDVDEGTRTRATLPDEIKRGDVYIDPKDHLGDLHYGNAHGELAWNVYLHSSKSIVGIHNQMDEGIDYSKPASCWI